MVNQLTTPSSLVSQAKRGDSIQQSTLKTSSNNKIPIGPRNRLQRRQEPVNYFPSSIPIESDCVIETESGDFIPANPEVLPH